MSFFGVRPQSTGHSTTHRSNSISGPYAAPRAPSSGSWVRPHKASSSYSSSSAYGRRPRDGFIARMLYKIKRALRHLVRYARRHPMKILLPIIMALVSGGALSGLARKMGVPIPQALAGMVGAGRSAKGGYDAWYGSQDVESGVMGGGGGMMRGALKVASAFL